MSTIALNNLLTYILSLGLSQRNRKWLAEHIIEPDVDVMAAKQYKQFEANIIQAKHELDEHRNGNLKLKPVEDLLNEL